MKTQRCYIYTRVSTSMQVDGFSLDAQKERLRKYAEFQEMLVVGEYSDEGKSGKNIEGRPEFLRMLNDIESGKDQVSYVLVFKLSRFGRNAADVLGSLQRMQDFGVNLICVEDGIDSSKDSGKLMISVLSAVAEIERENILVQTMEGRRQKAREGKWNGGFAPYGYKLVDGYLQIADDETEVIRLIFDKYANTNMGAPGIANYLNEHGYVKKKRQNNTLDVFSTSFVRGVLENPIYAGRMAYGRRKTEKIQGTRNQYHVVEQKEFAVYDGVHEGIISEELWQKTVEKRQKNSTTWEKVYHPERENLLSGLLRCPVCGAGMYGNVNRKRKKDGTFYKEYYYYACKHRMEVDGHRCDYNRQWKQERVNEAVEEIIKKLVRNPKFENAMREKIGSRIDTKELEQELELLQKRHRQIIGAKKKLGQQMDALDITDPFYEQKYSDMDERLCKLYENIAAVDKSIEEIQARIHNIQQQKITGDNVYQFLLYFDMLYDKFTDSEKKEFLQSFIECVELFPEEQPDGRFLKRIKFRFPVYFEGAEVENLRWDNETTVESVVTLTKSCEEPDSKGNAPIADCEEHRQELQCRIYPLGSLEQYKYTVICSNYKGKWILSRHKKRDTWETQGGHIEEGETPLECARRELFEESGIRDAELYPVCDYVGFDHQSSANGMVFLAVVHSLGELPESEMKEIGLFDSLPAELTYPETSPKLYAQAEKLLGEKKCECSVTT